MKQTVKRGIERSRDGLTWYADNDLWFILPVLTVVILYMLCTHG